jgi:hypothetical protein
VIFVFWLYKDYKIDSFRQKMFRIRDGLFDEVVKGNISFSDKPYAMLRSVTNGNIRFAHRLNLPQAILFVSLIKKESTTLGETFSKRFEDSLEGLSDAQRKIYEDCFLQINFTVVEHIVLSSPLFLVTILVPLTFALVAKKHVSEIVSRLKPSLDKIETATLVNDELAAC